MITEVLLEMSDGDYFMVPRTVITDNATKYEIVYEDGTILSTTSGERIFWLRREMSNLVSFSLSIPGKKRDQEKNGITKKRDQEKREIVEFPSFSSFRPFTPGS